MRPETKRLINEREHILEKPIPTVDERTISLGELFARFSEHDIGLYFNEQTLRYGTKSTFSSNENLSSTSVMMSTLYGMALSSHILLIRSLRTYILAMMIWRCSRIIR